MKAILIAAVIGGVIFVAAGAELTPGAFMSGALVGAGVQIGMRLLGVS